MVNIKKQAFKTTLFRNVIIGLLFIFVISISFLNFWQKESELSYFRAENILNLGLYFPKHYAVLEKNGQLILQNDNNWIIIDRLATEFDSVPTHLQNLNKNSQDIEIKDEKKVYVGTREALVRTRLVNSKEIRTYYILIDGYIYMFSTEFPSLYSDLDQIAQSFEYLGD
jgi:hypothetical protein